MNTNQIINLVSTFFTATSAVAATWGVEAQNTWAAVGGLVVAILTLIASHAAHSSPASGDPPAPARTSASRLIGLVIALVCAAGLITGCFATAPGSRGGIQVGFLGSNGFGAKVVSQSGTNAACCTNWYVLRLPITTVSLVQMIETSEGLP
jgi:hypothetical protein